MIFHQSLPGGFRRPNPQHSDWTLTWFEGITLVLSLVQNYQYGNRKRGQLDQQIEQLNKLTHSTWPHYVMLEKSPNNYIIYLFNFFTHSVTKTWLSDCSLMSAQMGEGRSLKKLTLIYIQSVMWGLVFWTQHYEIIQQSPHNQPKTLKLRFRSVIKYILILWHLVILSWACILL